MDYVASVQETHGLAPALSVVGLPRSTWYYHRRQKVSFAEKYAHLRPVLEEIARAHPEYGVPRTVVELRETYGLQVNHKVVRRLHRLWDLALLRATKAPKPSPIRQVIDLAGDRANLVARLEAIEPFAVTYTDFTEIPYANGQRKAYFMPLLGHRSKVVYGWAVSQRANRATALAAWESAKATWLAEGIEWQGMIVHQDQDPVYTSYAWTAQLLQRDQARLSYALNGAKDNPVMESFFGRFKSEGHSRFLAADDLEQLEQIVAERVDYYNRSRRHSSLGYQTPLAALRQMRLNCQGAVAVDSVDNPDGVAHPAHSPATTAAHRRREVKIQRSRS